MNTHEYKVQILKTPEQRRAQNAVVKLEAGHSIECKLTPATWSTFALLDPVTLTFDLSAPK